MVTVGLPRKRSARRSFGIIRLSFYAFIIASPSFLLFSVPSIRLSGDVSVEDWAGQLVTELEDSSPEEVSSWTHSEGATTAPSSVPGPYEDAEDSKQGVEGGPGWAEWGAVDTEELAVQKSSQTSASAAEAFSSFLRNRYKRKEAIVEEWSQREVESGGGSAADQELGTAPPEPSLRVEPRAPEDDTSNAERHERNDVEQQPDFQVAEDEAAPGKDDPEANEVAGDVPDREDDTGIAPGNKQASECADASLPRPPLELLSAELLQHIPPRGQPAVSLEEPGDAKPGKAGKTAKPPIVVLCETIDRDARREQFLPLMQRNPGKDIYMINPQLIYTFRFVWHELRKVVERRHKNANYNDKPMTGWTTVMMALQMCSQVDLYGFQPYRGSAKELYHYFDSQAASLKVHSFDLAYEMLQLLGERLPVRLMAPPQSR
eukprot:gene1786-2452_t